MSRIGRGAFAQAGQCKFDDSQSWRVDESSMRMKGQWFYQYLDIDKHGKIIELMLWKRCNEAATTVFFKKHLKSTVFRTMPWLISCKSNISSTALSRIPVPLRTSSTWWVGRNPLPSPQQQSMKLRQRMWSTRSRLERTQNRHSSSSRSWLVNCVKN